MKYVIGVDIGTQSSKALLVDANGRIVAQHSRSYQVDTPRPLWAEQWPQVWFDAVRACIGECVRQAQAAPGFDPAQVAAICISSLYGGSGIPVDAEMQPLHPCLIWMDRRANDEVAWIRKTLDVDRLRTLTGNGIDSYYGYTKMLWIKNQRPEIWEKTRYFLPPNSYINYLLTGELAVDHSSAGNIGGVYDIVGRNWCPETMAMLGIPLQMMPSRLLQSSDAVGGLLPQWAQEFGLPAGIPLMAGGVDAAVATLAAGAVKAGNHVAMIGTSMCWGYLNQHTDASHGLISMPHVFNGLQDNYIFGGAITAGASVSWFREQFCQAEIAEAKQQQVDPHQLLEVRAAAIAPGCDGVLFLPYLMGERSPVWDAGASGAFVGLSLYHSRAHMYRAVLEGVSFALKHNMDAGAKGALFLDERLVVVGGASHSDLWMQIIADITGYAVYTIKENVEAALGAALLAAYGAGLVSREDVKQGWVSLEQRASPDAARHRMYAARFEVYRELYPALKPIMHKLQTA
ncbi:FGGY-family carbohydrate kinase [Collimonas fungivorans]|uniref:FGGY-family carbohydrate kinase n=1 Tax=Collimonas fungivorans TaxID=158899 RepID=UPI003FA397B8